MKMNKHVELPLMEPLYQTYHTQGTATAIICSNPSIRNWYLNEIMNLRCHRKFLTGLTTPGLNIEDSSWADNPYFDKITIPMQFAKGYVNPIIREILDQGYYAAFNGVDDYYVQGKSWYKERHFKHGGLICGYDQDEKTYCIYAYDSQWRYQKFWTPQKAFNAGRIAIQKTGTFGHLYAIKPQQEEIKFSPKTVCEKLKEYLDSNLDKYPFDGKGVVYGLVVHEYIAKYIEKLHDGSIPYERMDRRVCRLIWEHKKVMLERIKALEHSLDMADNFSDKYEPLVKEADAMRMLYASHHMKRRDSVLPIIREKLLRLMASEQEILLSLVEELERSLNDEAVGIS